MAAQNPFPRMCRLYFATTKELYDCRVSLHKPGAAERRTPPPIKLPPPTKVFLKIRLLSMSYYKTNLYKNLFTFSGSTRQGAVSYGRSTAPPTANFTRERKVWLELKLQKKDIKLVSMSGKELILWVTPGAYKIVYRLQKGEDKQAGQFLFNQIQTQCFGESSDESQVTPEFPIKYKFAHGLKQGEMEFIRKETAERAKKFIFPRENSDNQQISNELISEKCFYQKEILFFWSHAFLYYFYMLSSTGELAGEFLTGFWKTFTEYKNFLNRDTSFLRNWDDPSLALPAAHIVGGQASCYDSFMNTWSVISNPITITGSDCLEVPTSQRNIRIYREELAFFRYATIPGRWSLTVFLHPCAAGWYFTFQFQDYHHYTWFTTLFEKMLGETYVDVNFQKEKKIRQLLLLNVIDLDDQSACLADLDLLMSAVHGKGTLWPTYGTIQLRWKRDNDHSALNWLEYASRTQSFIVDDCKRLIRRLLNRLAFDLVVNYRIVDDMRKRQLYEKFRGKLWAYYNRDVPLCWTGEKVANYEERYTSFQAPI